MARPRPTWLGSPASPERRDPLVRRAARRLVLLSATLLLVALVHQVPGAGQDDAAADARADELARGAAVFQRNCAACHGMRARGRPGDSVSAGPPIDDVEMAYVDLVLRTGRMPVAAPELGVRNERLSSEDRQAVVAWMTERFELEGELPSPSPGQAAEGLDPFVQHCAACHGAGGDGGVAGGGTFVPAITGTDPVTVAEAARVGPFAMPAFSESLLDDPTLDDIIAYLEAAEAQPSTLLGLREIDEVATGVAAAVLVAALLVLVRTVPQPDGDGEDAP